jgi:hypothetical protein
VVIGGKSSAFDLPTADAADWRTRSSRRSERRLEA